MSFCCDLLISSHIDNSFTWRAGVDKVVVGDLVHDTDAQDTAEELDMPKAKITDSSEIGVTEVAIDDVVDADVTAEARNKIKVLQLNFIYSCCSRCE